MLLILYIPHIIVQANLIHAATIIHILYDKHALTILKLAYLLSLVKILSANMFFCIKDCIVDMVTFTTLAKLLSLKTHEKCQLYGMCNFRIITFAWFPTLKLLKLFWIPQPCLFYYTITTLCCSEFMHADGECHNKWRIQLQCKSSTGHCPIWVQIHRVE